MWYDGKRYGIVSRGLHWVTAGLVLTLLGVSWWMSELPGVSKAEAYTLHKLTGLFVLLLTVLRISWRGMQGSLPGVGALWQKRIRKVAHFILYLLLLWVPLTGWLMSSAAGYAPTLFTLRLSMPYVLKHAQLAKQANVLHHYGIYALLAMLALHILAAVYHKQWVRDEVWSRMVGERV